MRGTSPGGIGRPDQMLYLRDENLRQGIELMFFAYRDFISDPDKKLSDYRFGRAHHRVLFFVNRLPGLTVAELLDILKITKQSLARVLKQLIEQGYIVQSAGQHDRRKRLLFPTRTGRELILQLSSPQSRRLNRAFAKMDDADRATILGFLSAMMDDDPPTTFLPESG